MHPYGHSTRIVQNSEKSLFGRRLLKSLADFDSDSFYSNYRSSENEIHAPEISRPPALSHPIPHNPSLPLFLSHPHKVPPTYRPRLPIFTGCHPPTEHLPWRGIAVGATHPPLTHRGGEHRGWCHPPIERGRPTAGCQTCHPSFSSALPVGGGLTRGD